MFKTSQPNPDKSKNERILTRNGETIPEFESRADFAQWIDEQLQKLESSQKQFLTLKSKRAYFDRNGN